MASPAWTTIVSPILAVTRATLTSSSPVAGVYHGQVTRQHTHHPDLGRRVGAGDADLAAASMLVERCHAAHRRHF
jgi:hypothetical protein